MEKPKRGRTAATVLAALLLIGHVNNLTQPVEVGRWDIFTVAGTVGAVIATVAAVLLWAVTKKRAMLFFGPPLLAIISSPVALSFMMVMPLTSNDVADSVGTGTVYGFILGLLLWGLMGPGDQSGVLADARLPSVVTVTVTKEGGLSLFPRIEEGDAVAHKMRTLAPGESHLGVPFAEWERHAGSTVRVSQDRTLVPLTT